MPDHAAEVQLVTSWDVAESKPGDRAEPSSREISITLAIVGTVALGFWIVVALVTRAPWIHPDEMIYADMARSIAAGELPTVRGAGASGFGVLYPLLVAPAWFFDDPDRAYAATRILNALLMTLTLIPAYFLAREFLPRTR